MKLAVFTNQFPSRVSTFFARDLRTLCDAGIDLDVFAIYPIEPELWRYVPEVLPDSIFPRNRVHYLSFRQSFLILFRQGLNGFLRFLKLALPVEISALRYGPLQLAKSLYVLIQGFAWAQISGKDYDHILAYWGNYSATCGYAFRYFSRNEIPFSIFLHAGVDLYRDQIYLKEKLLSAANIFVVCDFNRQYLAKKYPRDFSKLAPKIHLHHLGLDLEEFPFRLEGRRENMAIAVGTLARPKGFEDLIRAAALLLERGQEINVQIIGTGPDEADMRRLAERLHLGDRVHFTGWLPFEQVREIMCTASVLVHPSRGLGDAVPTVIKEAMASGTPVIGTRVAGIPELLDGGRCGLLVPPRDPHHLADAIEEVLTDRTLWLGLAIAGRTFAEQKFNLWENGQRLAEILRQSSLQVSYPAAVLSEVS